MVERSEDSLTNAQYTENVITPLWLASYNSHLPSYHAKSFVLSVALTKR